MTGTVAVMTGMVSVTTGMVSVMTGMSSVKSLETLINKGFNNKKRQK
jgi:hypothetical protein